jgi:hypothetical protein
MLMTRSEVKCVITAGHPKSETADIDGARALTAAGLDDSLAAIERRAAVVTMMDGIVMPVVALRGRGSFRCIADDDGLARHDRLPFASNLRMLPAFWLSVVRVTRRVQGGFATIVFPERFAAVAAVKIGGRECRDQSGPIVYEGMAIDN